MENITMEQLFSGFVGALIATVLSIIYLYFSVQAKLRIELVLEIVGFCDDFYHRITNLRLLKDKKFTATGEPIDIEEYRAHSYELTLLLISTKLQTKAAIVFSENKAFPMFMELSEHYRETASILRKSTRSGWIKENNQINDLLINKIEPRRRELLECLLKSTSIVSIALDIISKIKNQIKK